MKVLVIPEDFRKDQYILKPLISSLVKALGARSTRVEICRDPLLGGIGEALKSERLEAIVERHKGMTDLFVLCVDRDGIVGRRQRLNQLEAYFAGFTLFLAENAWEELETWALAGLDLPSEWGWTEVRSEVDVKERYFEPYAQQRGLSDSPGGGRKTLGEEASHRINVIRQKCPEDFDALAERLQAFV